MRILVVEDEAAIADFLQRGLQAEGHAVGCAYDGEEGERRAVSEDVDLVILDVMLPLRDGFDVLRMIRGRKPGLAVIMLTARADVVVPPTTRGKKPGLPVIMLTARADVEDRVTGLDSGATDYVTKPFSFE